MVVVATAALVFAENGGGNDKGGQENGRERKGPNRLGGGGRGKEQTPMDDVRSLFKTEVPEHETDVLLGRPTNNSVTVTVVAYRELEGVIEYGSAGGSALERTKPFPLKPREPVSVELKGLHGREQKYRLAFREPGGAWCAGEMRRFRLQAPSGVSFRFAIQADSHLDYNTDPALYTRCLQNVAADGVDFMVDLGDTFMTDKHRSREMAESQYYAQRFYFGSIGYSVPFFLVLGNHDGESGKLAEGSDSMAAWSNKMRRRLFPNPEPGDFFSGNSKKHPELGLLQNYYAWEWGDALFIALDPFWSTPRQRGGEDNWVRTLGREQYDWLQQTLERSRAKFRFVFIHHLVGGQGRDARGGSEASRLYEWGGRDEQDRDLFREKRSGWPMPIHDLLVKYRVNAVFHGHDHLYVRQERDGVIYHEVPQPGYARYDNTRSAEEYGYKSGLLQGSSGHLRVTVAAGAAQVEYVRSVLPGDETVQRKNGAVTDRYELKPNR